MYLGSFGINDYLGIPAATHRFSSGAAYAPTVLTYSIYEEATDVGIDENVDMVVASPFDGIVGCYWVRRQLTAAAGFEAGKNYLVVVKATVDSVAAIQMHTFQIAAKVDTRYVGGTIQTAGDVPALVVTADAAVDAIATTIGVAGVGLTNLGDARIANLDAAVSTRSAPGAAMTLTGAYDAAKTAAQAGNAMTLTGAYDAAKTAAQPADIPTAAANADAFLGRNLAGGSDGGRTVRSALRKLRNKWSIAGTTLTITAEDDTTVDHTEALTVDGSAEPVIGSDPA